MKVRFLFALLLALALPGLTAPRLLAEVATGDKVRLQLTTLDDEIITNGSLEDRVGVFYFWATWNAASRQDLMMISDIHKEYKDEALFVGVSRDLSISKLENYLSDYPLKWPQVLDRDQHRSLAESWRVTEMPHVVIVSIDGKVLWRGNSTGAPAMVKEMVARTRLDRQIAQEEAAARQEDRAKPEPEPQAPWNRPSDEVVGDQETLTEAIAFLDEAAAAIDQYDDYEIALMLVDDIREEALAAETVQAHAKTLSSQLIANGQDADLMQQAIDAQPEGARKLKALMGRELVRRSGNSESEERPTSREARSIARGETTGGSTTAKSDQATEPEAERRQSGSSLLLTNPRLINRYGRLNEQPREARRNAEPKQTAQKRREDVRLRVKFRRAERYRADERPVEAYRLYRWIVEHGRDSDYAVEARKHIAQMEQDPAFRDKMGQAVDHKEADALLQMAENYETNGYNIAAKHTYQRLVDDFDGTPAAQTARARLRRMEYQKKND